MLRRIFVALCLCSLPVHLTAGVIYNNFSDSFILSIPILYSDVNPVVGTTFIATGGGNLSSIELALADTSPPISGGLYTSSEREPATLLESWNITPAGFDSLTTLTSIEHPYLSAGTEYWFLMNNPATLLWGPNDESVAGGYYSGGNSGLLVHQVATSPAAGIRLNSLPSAATPEPATGLLLVLGCLTLTRLKSRRRSDT